ncbi:hypothetical protein ACLIM5_003351 [Vibrio cholerae]
MHNITIGSPSADEIKALIDAIPEDTKEIYLHCTAKHNFWCAAMAVELTRLGFTADTIVTFNSLTFKR